MAGIKALIFLAFSASIGLLFVVLGCALKLPDHASFWPMFVLVFYLLTPIPLLISKRYQDDMSSSSACMEFSIFSTTGIVLSAFALPLILAHVGVINWGAMGLISVGNIVSFLTILAYFYVYRDDDTFGYSNW